jgi:hypothetical protein
MLSLVESSASDPSSPFTLSSSSNVSLPHLSPSPLPEATKFLYSCLHRVDNLVRRYHGLRQESDSTAKLLAALSHRLALIQNSSLGPCIRNIDYDNILCPFSRLGLADRVAITLKENIEKSMLELDGNLSEMELLCMSVGDVLVTLTQVVEVFSNEELSREAAKGRDHVEQIYSTLFSKVRGEYLSFLSFFFILLIGARRNLWYEFTADEKRKAFLSASTLGDILLTPPVEWEEFAKQWAALDGEQKSDVRDEVDDLTAAMDNWGTHEEMTEMEG